MKNEKAKKVKKMKKPDVKTIKRNQSKLINNDVNFMQPVKRKNHYVKQSNRILRSTSRSKSSNEYENIEEQLEQILKLPERPPDGSKTEDEILDDFDKVIAQCQKRPMLKMLC